MRSITAGIVLVAIGTFIASNRFRFGLDWGHLLSVHVFLRRRALLSAVTASRLLARLSVLLGFERVRSEGMDWRVCASVMARKYPSLEHAIASLPA